MVDRLSGGHHDDIIVVLSTRLKLPAEVRYVFSLLQENVARNTIAAELPDRIGKKNDTSLQFDKAWGVPRRDPSR
ncbi:hypothetical protein HLASF_0485 [Halanaeroarchaeum sulfurireducens]|uniref:Uncharacterized protein n=1 Tax=Halanaeroarchaeum sulfurireducens TaxID=1604004 RepID=A0A0F7P701_9EURY|nr:hypothetical protein HLASF_0485 [Halanaeroarchaeum sulfurireducens]ALG81387.1 hypothetical protein HLASA_0482 [Halanaeroarchaeum sulfurireducens]